MIKIFLPLFIPLILLSCSKKTDTKQDSLNFNTEVSAMKVRNKNLLTEIDQNGLDFEHLEVIYASIGDKYYSWLGHIFIRFYGSNSDPKKDLALSYLPLFTTDEVDNIKAYYGGYPAYPLIRDWEYFVDDYVGNEKRYLDIYRISLNHEQKSKTIARIIELLKEPFSIGEYSFRRRNCTFFPMQFLKEIGLNVDITKTTFPINFIHYLKDQKLLSQYKKVIHSENINLAFERKHD